MLLRTHSSQRAALRNDLLLLTMNSSRRCVLLLLCFMTTVSEVFLTNLPLAIEITSRGGSAPYERLTQDPIAAEIPHPQNVVLDSSEENEFLTVVAPFADLDLNADNSKADSDITYQDGNKQKTEHANDADQSPVRIGTETGSASANGYKVIAGNSSVADFEEVPKFKSVEYERRPAGTILDEFVTGKLGSSDVGSTLPIFLTEPESTFVVKNRPAVLKCKAAHALQLHFKCSGSSQPPPSTHDKHVDPHTGVHLEEVTATIHRDLVDEYFGKGPFKCECQAWSSRGVVKSQSATINIAYMRKQFASSPTSLRVEIDTRAELICEPPNGFPEPKISWHKNNLPILVTSDHELTAAGTLSFLHVTLQDMANYTCSAENIAGKRTSDSAVLIVYVNGGWSFWSSWKECKCSGKQSQGRKRTRTCSNPMPMNGGSQCSGPQIQKSSDCVSCPEDTQIINTDGFDITSSKRSGRWSAWSEWSSCSSDCIQIRRRKCITNAVDDVIVGASVVGMPGGGSSGIGTGATSNGANGANGYIKSLCSGKDIQTAECRGEHCHIGKDDFDWTLYLGLAFITAVCFAFGTALICCARRGIGANPHYNMARTVMDSEYMQSVDKKEMRMHIEAVNVSYDYAHPGHRFAPNEQVVNCDMTEHHYDVPNLSANYTNPIDELSVDYLTDTPDTSTADTSNSTYDITAKISTVHSMSKSTISEPLNSNGGALRLYKGEIMLYIPELAIGKNIKKNLSLMLLSDDSSRICLPSIESLLICSPIVQCSPRNYSFLKPVILKIPHCLVDPDLWTVNIYHADNDHDDLNATWRKILVVGEETINTPVFVQLEPAHVYVMTELLGRFVVIADAKSQTTTTQPCVQVQPSIKMKLIAFSQLTPPCSTNCSLRIYVVKDFPNSKDLCTRIESQLGGSYMGESETFAFHLNSCNLNIRVARLAEPNCRGTEALPVCEDQPLHEHVIPYNHILSNNSILHCEFSIRRGQQHLNTALALDIDFMQCSGGGLATQFNGELYSFSIPADRSASLCAAADAIAERQTLAVSIDRQGNYVNDIVAACSVDDLSSVQLPRVTKRLICNALDPPRSDERDWRLLAKKLNTNRYIAYFATKPSPTEQILNLWECRACCSTAHTIVELLMTLKAMDRQDIIDIITETIGPLWI